MNQQTANETYLIYDVRSKKIMGKYKSFHRALNKRDKLDLEYGAVKYGIRRSSDNTLI